MDQFNYFHQEVRAIIITNIQNKDLNVMFLSKSIGISRSQLYRRIKKATGLSIASFIKQVRLEEGKELLKSTDWNVTTIANNVGFQSSSYFSTSYKKLFGYPPREQRHKKRT